MCPYPWVSHPLIHISKEAGVKLNAVETQRGFGNKEGIFLPGFKN